MIVLHLLDFDAALADGDAALQTSIATTAITGEDLDAIQRCDNAALHAALIKTLLRFRVRLTLTSMVSSGGRENPHRL